jgi:hypothetical protein
MVMVLLKGKRNVHGKLEEKTQEKDNVLELSLLVPKISYYHPCCIAGYCWRLLDLK